MNILNSYTVKTLAKNRTRTVVTIIGIILSVAMITAVTTFISTIQDFLLRATIATDGDWYGAVYQLNDGELERLRGNDQVVACAALSTIGYAKLESVANPEKPYLYVGGMDDTFENTMPVYITEGRMPQNAQELILPNHLRTNGGIKYQLGQTVTLELGERTAQSGGALTQADLYEPEGPSEAFTARQTYTYTVVGFYERPSFENWNAPGYTALTRVQGGSSDAYFKLTSARATYDFIGTNFPDKAATVNSDLLRALGASDEGTFNSVFYSMAAILIFIIVFASVSLIYNAFSISVSERTKQFGLLSSVGATKRQLRRSVRFEALSLSAIGIPLGVGAGILGIGVTLSLMQPMFNLISSAEDKVTLHMTVSVMSIIVAAVLGLITVLISAAIPARRAVKMSAIDAIRQTHDINIKARSVKTGKLTYKLFGVEGVIARKNFKRNRKQYRSTVFSLFMSIVLFISASSFCAYLSGGVNDIIDDMSYDIQYFYSPESSSSVDAVFTNLLNTKKVTAGSYFDAKSATLTLPAESLDEKYRAFMGASGDTASVNATIFFVDNNTYRRFLSENGLSEDVYMNETDPSAVVYDFVKLFNGEDGRYYTFNALKNGGVAASAELVDDEGNTYSINTALGALSENCPMGTDSQRGLLMLIYPFSARGAVLGEDGGDSGVQMCFKSSDHNATYDDMTQMLENMSLQTSGLYDYTRMMETNRAVLTIVNVFSYGFITLISLIAAANVFNTVSTSVSLRRREFAMLRSTGMTSRGFNRMMNYECLLYGAKALLWGLPASLLLTYLIYCAMSSGWATGFFIPISSILIAVLSVFLVVFASMLYAMRRIKRENTIDALKNENI